MYEICLVDMAPVSSFLKGLKLQWLGYIMSRLGDYKVRIVLEWKSQGKRPDAGNGGSTFLKIT